MKKNWVIHPKLDEALGIAQELGIHPVVANILLRRGFRSPAEITQFLNPSLDTLEIPFAFRDMSKAVERIRLAITRKEKILVYGDYDVDGVTGSAILYPILKKMGADVEVHVPHRVEDGYGLNRASLERLLKKNFTLVITVDNGITGVEAIQFLNDKGVDTIIVDHHVPKGAVPPAFAIISGTVFDQKGDPNLAACGLVFKLGWALLGSFDSVKDYLDLVAVGTVADLAPVLGDNRILLKHGLPILARTKRIGLRALMDKARISKTGVSYRDIAFGLGPRINASGRMGSPLNAFRLLTTENEVEARNLAQLLDDGNKDRQQVESLAFEEALERVERDFLAESERVLVVENEDWHEGVLGIVAARLVERYQKPSIVISMKNGIGKGSGRSIPSFSIFETVLKCEELLLSFGGHAQACGLTLKEENLPLFRKKLNEAARLSEPSSASVPLEIEAEVLLGQWSAGLLKDLDQMAPFGPGNRKPLFLSKGIRLRGALKRRGKDTLQGWVTDEAGKITSEMIGFRSYDRWMKSRTAAQVAAPLFDIVYQPVLKDFNGIASIELQLEDWV
jgi:single-stranded-DNA-specific exonuclease